jgi:pseudouridine synthase
MKTKILGIRTGMVELEIVLSEGRNRQIRRVMGRINMEVVKLIRTKIGSLSLDKLEIKEGEILQLSEEEIAGL